MFKAWDIVCALVSLWLALAICEDCLYQIELWPTDNPKTFYYCDPDTNQTAIGNCGAGTGFIRNGTTTGCVPWIEWSDKCVNKVNLSTINCNGDDFLIPHGIANPEGFYMCVARNASPVEIPCPEGRGFHIDNEGYMGCFPWAMWKNLTGC